MLSDRSVFRGLWFRGLRVWHFMGLGVLGVWGFGSLGFWWFRVWGFRVWGGLGLTWRLMGLSNYLSLANKLPNSPS